MKSIFRCSHPANPAISRMYQINSILQQDILSENNKLSSSGTLESKVGLKAERRPWHSGKQHFQFTLLPLAIPFQLYLWISKFAVSYLGEWLQMESGWLVVARYPIRAKERCIHEIAVSPGGHQQKNGESFACPFHISSLFSSAPNFGI